MVGIDSTVDSPLLTLSTEVPVLLAQPMEFLRSVLPAQLPLILGDCLQNLRSSLDYLVWELVVAAKGQPNEKNAFPICEDAGRFKESLGRGRLRGLSTDAIEEVEMFQPYFDGRDFREHPYWLLDKLCNINKHRRILLTRLKAGYGGRTPGSDRYTQVAGNLGEVVDMDVELIAFVAFEEGGIIKGSEVISFTSQLIDSVERVIPNFDRFFV
jgi:hypothetical protein